MYINLNVNFLEYNKIIEMCEKTAHLQIPNNKIVRAMT